MQCTVFSSSYNLTHKRCEYAFSCSDRWRRIGGEGGNSISRLHSCWPQQSRGYITSMISQCYAVTLLDTYSAGQHKMWIEAMSWKSVFPFFSPAPLNTLPSGINWIQTINLVYTRTSMLQVVISIVKEKSKGRMDRKMDGQQTLVEDSDGVVDDCSFQAA